MMNKKILVCDDDVDILEMLVLLLETYGYDVISESKSPNVFDTIAKENPGLLIVDLWMPLMSGDLVIKQLRNFSETKYLPIIMISACMDGQQTAAIAGASHFISKPFDIFNLLDKVEQYYAQAS
ncbi:MAG: response regulator [Janthinobacterium lividum]